MAAVNQPPTAPSPGPGPGLSLLAPQVPIRRTARLLAGAPARPWDAQGGGIPEPRAWPGYGADVNRTAGRRRSCMRNSCPLALHVMRVSP